MGTAMSKVRENGELIDIPQFSRSRPLDFGDGKGTSGFNLPWADVFTAYFSTGIPNIEVYIPPSSAVTRSMSQLRPIIPLLRYQWAIKLLKRIVGATMKGPGEAVLDSGTCHVVGEVRNAKGEIRRARMSTPNGYRLTVDGMLMAVAHLLEHPEHKGPHANHADGCQLRRAVARRLADCCLLRKSGFGGGDADSVEVGVP